MKKKKLVHVGTFGQPQGLKGEIKVNIFTSSFESFKLLQNFFIDDNKSILIITKLRRVGKKIICSLDNCNDRDSSLLFKGVRIFVLRENFPQTKDSEYYIVDLIGCVVLDKKNNMLGTIRDIKNFGAGDLIEINSPNKDFFYIPMNQENLVKVDYEKKIVVVNPIYGLIE